MDPAFAPGTGTPVPGGFSTWEALQLIRGLKDLDIVGYDIVEVAPAFDTGGITSIAAAGLIQEFMSLIAWINPYKTDFCESIDCCELNQSDIDDAEQRLLRFAPFIQKYFPETGIQNGLIESPLVEIEAMKQCRIEECFWRLCSLLFRRTGSVTMYATGNGNRP